MTLRTSSVKDLTERRPTGNGGGHAMTWICYRCKQGKVGMLGARGAWPYRRCASCVAEGK